MVLKHTKQWWIMSIVKYNIQVIVQRLVGKYQFIRMKMNLWLQYDYNVLSLDNGPT